MRRIVLSVASAEKRRFLTSVSFLNADPATKSVEASESSSNICKILVARGVSGGNAAKITRRSSQASEDQVLRLLDALKSCGISQQQLENILILAPVSSATDLVARLEQLLARLSDLKVERKVRATIVWQHRHWIFNSSVDEFDNLVANLCSLLRCFMAYKVDLSKWIVQMRPSCKEKLDATKNFLLEHAGSERSFRKMVQCIPMMLQYDVEKHLKPRVMTLYAMGLSKEQMTKILYKCPRILCVTEDRTTAVMAYLVEILGFPRDQACRIVAIFPRLATSKCQVIADKLDYFVAWGMERSKVRLMLRKNPSLMGLNMETGVKPKLEFLKSIDFQCKDLVHLLSMHAGALTRNRQWMEARLNFFLSRGLSRDECSLLFRSKPSIFNLREELLEKKLNFYARVMKQPVTNLTKFTSYLSYGLESKIRPRIEFQNWLYMEGLARRHFCYRYFVLMSKDVFARRFLVSAEAIQAYQRCKL